MTTFTVRHTIECNAETFWKLFFDKTFNEELFRKHLGFSQFDIVEHRETDSQIIRKVRGTPKVDLPGPIAKLMGSNFSYTEEGTFEKSSKRWRWKMTPSTLADKLRNEGTVTLEPAGENKVTRVAEIIAEAKVFGLGGMIESTTEKQLRDGWDKSATFFNTWIRTGRTTG
ncbi:MAG: DUF2505 domain-containing protein [Deltaproteobacteria bacterium]|nr:DUF2505 domain-containing protein [Deltaproteobacteria bacterium]